VIAPPRKSSRPSLPRAFSAGVGLALALVASGAALVGAQERDDQGPELERVWVPRKAFTKILARHPGGVLLSERELESLVKRARAQRAAGKAPLQPDAPQLATLEALSYTGRLEGETVSLQARARVAVQGRRTGIQLPLRGIGLTGVWVEGKPAQVVVGDRGPVVLLPGSATPTTREVRWTFALRVKAPAGNPEVGAGRIEFAIPPAASASLSLTLPGEVEPLPGRFGTRWVETTNTAGTRLRAAFGGGRGATQRLLGIAWRPRRALNAAKPYVSARGQTLFTIRRGLGTLRSRVEFSVFRAPRERFRLLLPPDFVVRELSSPQGKPSYLQRGRQVEVQWPTPRRGLLAVEITAERPSAEGNVREGGEPAWQRFGASPVRALDVDRSGGVFAIAAGPDTAVMFPSAKDKAAAALAQLERADLEAFDAGRLRPAPDASLVRVYRHIGGRGAVDVLQRRLAPQIALGIQALVQVEARELKALAFYRYAVEAGAVYAVKAQLPRGFSLEDLRVRDQRGRQPDHRVRERVGADGSVELSIELEEGLRSPSELLLTLQCAREIPRGVTNAPLAIPRFMGTPRTELRGLLGFTSDPTFRLSGRELRGLLAIPAADLPRAGLEAEGLALGYRVEGESYTGALAVSRRETRISVEQTEHHSTGERLLTSQFGLALEVSGAPVQSLELWLPEGSGELASVRGPGVLRERERVEVKEGRERWRLGFQSPWSGARTLRVEFQTTLAAPSAEGASEVSLPRVSVNRAFRQRGTIAVFSSGEAELQAKPEGLRPLEVTEAPPLGGDAGAPPGARDAQRPLFAFRWVRPDHGLTLTISRPGLTPVLSAVAEHLHLATSAGADGTARHMARFQVKNLDNQFFGLVLPEGATLWSVAVNGEGVKPAAREGVLLVPIPQAGQKGRQGTVVQATYTQATSRWGWLGEAELQAPSLTFGANPEDTVPVLRTTWALSLPEDVRALEVAGNLEGDVQRTFVEPLLRRGWRSWRHQSWPWWTLGLGLPALLILVSGRGRRGLFRVAQGTYRAGGSARSVAVELPWKRIAVAGGILLMAILIFGFCLSLGTSAYKSSERRFKDTARAMPAEPAHGPKGNRGPAGGTTRGLYAEQDLEESHPDYSFDSQKESPAAAAAPRRPGQGSKADLKERLGKLALKQEQKKGRESRKRPREKRQDGRRRRAPPPKSAPRPQPKPAAPSEPEPEPEMLDRLEEAENELPRGTVLLGDDDDDDGEDFDEGAGDEAPDESPSESAPDPSSLDLPADGPAPGSDNANNERDKLANKELGGESVADAYGVGGGAAGAYGQRWDKKAGSSTSPETPDLASALNAQTKTLGDGKALAKISELGAGGEVGLRSLVLELGAVGQGVAFHRSGGGATLRLSLASERLFVVLGGLFAVLGFLGALLVPASRRLSGLTLVVAGLALTTLVPLIWSGALLGALSNALTLGLLSAAPVLLLGALTRSWRARPFSRLVAALRAG
jgi:hypothetical protein